MSLSLPLTVWTQLHVSKDLGDTWTNLGNNISRYSWRVLDEQYESPTALYYEVDINGEQQC